MLYAIMSLLFIHKECIIKNNIILSVHIVFMNLGCFFVVVRMKIKCSPFGKKNITHHK